MHKAYIVIFTCATSRSVILDLVEDNSSKNFTNSIKRWIARRGCPNKIISDNGTVFKSQDSQLLYSERGITWKFNLDGAPCSRGFWERLVGMVKRCFEKSTGSERLLFTELSTVLFGIENVLNNWPLYFMYDDDVPKVLTPDSLLYGRKLEFESKCIDEGYFWICWRKWIMTEKMCGAKGCWKILVDWHRDIWIVWGK